MERTSSVQTKETLKVSIKAKIQPLIESCFSKLTQQQCTNLISGKIDELTKHLLKDLLFNIVLIILDIVQEKMKTQCNVSKEDIVATVGNTVPQCFADVMEIKKKVKGKCAKSLTSLIVEEVTDRINYSGTNFLCPIKKIDRMVAKTCEMLKSFFGSVCKPKRSGIYRKKIRSVKFQPVLETIMEEEEEEEKDFIETEAQLQYAVLDTQEEANIDEVVQEMSHETTSNKESNSMPQDQPSEITAGNVSEFTFEEKLQQDQEEKEEECRMLVKTLVEDLILLIFNKAHMACSQQNSAALQKRLYDRIWDEAKKLDFNIPQEKFDNLEKTLYDDLCNSVTFPQLIAKTSMCLKQPFADEVIACSFRKNISKKQRTLTLFSFQGKNQKPCKCVVIIHKKPSEMSIVDDSELQDQTLELTPVTDLEKEPSELPKEPQTTTASDADLKADEKQEQNKIQREERCKLSIDVLLRELILHLYRKADIKYTEGNFETIYNRLYDQMWTEVEKEDFNIAPKKFKNLEKIIYKDICKRTTCPHVNTLMCTNAEELLADDIIINSFKEHISEKPGNLKRLVSSLWKTIKRPFRRHNKVAVI